MAKERPCVFKNCPNTLSERVPARIIECSHHQYLRLEKERLAKGLVEKFGLSVNDQEFLSLNLDSSYLCRASVLARYLSIPLTTFLGCIARKTILAEKERKRWFISAKEAARVIDLVRNWISIRKATAIAKICQETLAVFVLKGYFGPVCRNLRGILAIRKEYSPFLEAECRKLKIARRKWANRARRCLMEGEVSVSEVAARFKVSNTAVGDWIKAGKLKAEKRKGRWAIKL